MATNKKARKPPPNVGRKPDPGHDWNDPEPDIDEALATAERISKKIADAPAALWKSAFRFFEDVDEKAKSLHQTMSRSKKATTKQINALKGWESGIDKCLANAEPDDAAGDGDD